MNEFELEDDMADGEDPNDLWEQVHDILPKKLMDFVEGLLAHVQIQRNEYHRELRQLSQDNINRAAERTRQENDLWLRMSIFNPRARKLMDKKKPFIVVSIDEPYFALVYNLIRTHETKKNTWSAEDEAIFTTVMESVNYGSR